jgi:drug/metabolite transporter (DMT)-like permease
MAFNIRFRGQKVSWIQGFGSLLSLVGIVILVHPSFSLTSSKLLGDILFLSTAFTWAGYSLVCTDLTDKLPPFYITSVIGVMAGLEMGVVMVPFGFWGELGHYSASIWLAAGYLALFSSFFCYIFWNKGLQVLGSTSTSNFLFIMPVVSAIGSAIFLGERLKVLEAAGALLILWGVWTVAHYEERKARA